MANFENMVIFERFEDKKFKIQSIEDYNKIETFSIEELEDELNYIENKIKNKKDSFSIIDLNELKELASSIEMILIIKKTPPKEEREKMIDEMYLPEYRKDGYFNSEEFKKIEKEVDDYINTLEGVTNKNFEILKQEILKNKYNIDWVPYHKRYISGIDVTVD